MYSCTTGLKRPLIIFFTKLWQYLLLQLYKAWPYLTLYLTIFTQPLPNIVRGYHAYPNLAPSPNLYTFKNLMPDDFIN